MNLHATTVCVAGRGAIILGPSGSGKSSLALQLLASGAQLVADDRTDVARRGAQLIASAPEPISGMIEARGVGILRAKPTGPIPLSVVIDLSQIETARLPEPHTYEMLGVNLPCLYQIDAPYFAAAILLYLRCSIGSNT